MSSQSPFLLVPKHLLPVPQESGDIQKCNGLLPPVADRHSGKQGATGLAPAAAFLQGTAWGAKSSYHLRSNVTLAPAAETFHSELLSWFTSRRAIPSLLCWKQMELHVLFIPLSHRVTG